MPPRRRRGVPARSRRSWSRTCRRRGGERRDGGRQVLAAGDRGDALNRVTAAPSQRVGAAERLVITGPSGRRRGRRADGPVATAAAHEMMTVLAGASEAVSACQAGDMQVAVERLADDDGGDVRRPSGETHGRGSDGLAGSTWPSGALGLATAVAIAVATAVGGTCGDDRGDGRGRRAWRRPWRRPWRRSWRQAWRRSWR